MVTLSTQHNAKLLKKLKSGFERTINWIKYQSKVSLERQNQYLDFLIDPSFQGVNRPCFLSFKSEEDRETHTEYILLKIKIKDYTVMIDAKSIFHQLMKNDSKAYDKI